MDQALKDRIKAEVERVFEQQMVNPVTRKLHVDLHENPDKISDADAHARFVEGIKAADEARSAALALVDTL